MNGPSWRLHLGDSYRFSIGACLVADLSRLGGRGGYGDPPVQGINTLNGWNEAPGGFDSREEG